MKTSNFTLNPLKKNRNFIRSIRRKHVEKITEESKNGSIFWRQK